MVATNERKLTRRECRHLFQWHTNKTGSDILYLWKNRKQASFKLTSILIQGQLNTNSPPLPPSFAVSKCTPSIISRVNYYGIIHNQFPWLMAQLSMFMSCLITYFLISRGTHRVTRPYCAISVLRAYKYMRTSLFDVGLCLYSNHVSNTRLLAIPCSWWQGEGLWCPLWLMQDNETFCDYMMVFEVMMSLWGIMPTW